MYRMTFMASNRVNCKATFQNGIIYFGYPIFFLHLNISFSLNNKYAGLKKSMYFQIFKKLKTIIFLLKKENYLPVHNFLKFAY